MLFEKARVGFRFLIRKDHPMDFVRLVLKQQGNYVTSVFTDGSGLRTEHIRHFRPATKSEVLKELRYDLKTIREEYDESDPVN